MKVSVKNINFKYCPNNNLVTLVLFCRSAG